MPQISRVTLSTSLIMDRPWRDGGREGSTLWIPFLVARPPASSDATHARSGDATRVKSRGNLQHDICKLFDLRVDSGTLLYDLRFCNNTQDLNILLLGIGIGGFSAAGWVSSFLLPGPV